MAEIQPQETQQELFDFSGVPRRVERLPSIQKTHKPILISTSLEQLLFAAILAILAGCLVFFLGVLRGKSIAGPIARAVESPVVPAPRPVPATAAVPATVETPAVRAQVAAPRNEVMSSTARDASKPYTIQLVTYKKGDLAEKEVAALRRSGYYASVIRKGEYYAVCVGQYSGMEEAKKDLKFFGVKYKDRFLRRR